ncbi:MAG: alanine--glyoxylate aminotransferase family protein [Candidatus Omnitrophota bacterium]
MEKKYLLTPGPTPVPPVALEAMARPIIQHRTSQFQDILKEAEENLQYVFQTKEKVFILASSGTGAMEAAVSNVLSSGDKALVVRAGKFGERWGEICSAYKIDFVAIDVEWGRSVDPEDIKKILDKDSKIKAVYVTLCETSTGVTTDIKAIANITKDRDVIIVVDAISALGAVPLKTDEWGIDIVVAGSQKGLMIPPGLAFISMSQKALKRLGTSDLPKFYFDLKAYKKSIDKCDTPYTPCVNLIIGLNETLKLIKKEGIDNVIAGHQKNSLAVRNAMKALGLELFSPDFYSDAVTSVKVPDGIDGGKIVKTMRDKYGVAIAGGQGSLKGKIFRIATMGYITKSDLEVGITTLEIVLAELGYKFEKGVGVKTFKESLK